MEKPTETKKNTNCQAKTAKKITVFIEELQNVQFIIIWTVF